MQPESALADFALSLCAADVPAAGRQRAVDAITDCAGCALAGTKTQLAAILLSVLTEPAAGATFLFGTPRGAAPCDAALYNGAVAHALDFDDISHPAYSHPSAVLLPVLLACADLAAVTGKEAVTAYVIGLEVFGKLGRALNLQHYKNGWHATSTLGSLAAAVTAARLLRLSRPQLLATIGIAASAASGLRANFGTMTKPLHAGYAARNGLLAALLARSGFDASTEALSHRYGFVQTFNHGEGIALDALRDWGAPFEIMSEIGLALKPYPSCAATHTAIEAAAALRQTLNGCAGIARVRVGMSEFALEPLIYVRPATPLEAKFSMHFCVAAALSRDHIDLATFSPAAVADPVIGELITRIETYVDDRVRDDREFASVVSVETHRGERHERLVAIPAGKPSRWFTHAQLERKFLDCSGPCADGGRARAAFHALQHVDDDAPLSSVCAALVAMAERDA